MRLYNRVLSVGVCACVRACVSVGLYVCRPVRGVCVFPCYSGLRVVTNGLINSNVFKVNHQLLGSKGMHSICFEYLTSSKEMLKDPEPNVRISKTLSS